MYKSFDNGKKNCLDKFEQCPLALWKDHEDHSKGTVRVQNQAGMVSDLDYEWVKSTYPWKEPPQKPQKHQGVQRSCSIRRLNCTAVAVH